MKIRRAVIGAGVTLGLVSVLGSVALARDDADSRFSRGPSPEAVTCDGEEATLIARTGVMTVGTVGDDVVLVEVGAGYATGGGTDIVCSSDGSPPTTIYSDDEGPTAPPTAMPTPPSTDTP